MPDPSWLRDKAAIAGIGHTEFSKNSGRSEPRLAVEAPAAGEWTVIGSADSSRAAPRLSLGRLTRGADPHS